VSRAYADLTVEKLPTRVGVSAKTLGESEHGRRATKRWELFGIAEECGVPRSFFEADWELLPSHAVEPAKDEALTD
jgi:hypothetical protein